MGNPAAVPILGNPPAVTILPQFKLYYEYMLGDLWYTIREQEAGTKLVKRPSLKNRTRVELPAKPFPEGFLWMVSICTLVTYGFHGSYWKIAI